MQPSHYVPLVFPVVAPWSADSREAAVDMNVFHCVHGDASEFMLRKTAKTLRVKVLRKLRPCTGGSMAKGYRKPIASTTKSLGRVFVDLSGPVHSLADKRFIMIVKD